MGAVGALADLKPWTSLSGHRYLGIPTTARVMSILDCVAIQTMGGARQTYTVMNGQNARNKIENSMRNVLVDVSQNPCRRAFSNSNEVGKCLHTASIVYSFHRDRVLLPLELMMIHGHSRSIVIPDDMTPKELHDLAGMGITLPCLGLILVSAMLSTGLRWYNFLLQISTSVIYHMLYIYICKHLPSIDFMNIFAALYASKNILHIYWVLCSISLRKTWWNSVSATLTCTFCSPLCSSRKTIQMKRLKWGFQYKIQNPSELIHCEKHKVDKTNCLDRTPASFCWTVGECEELTFAGVVWG